MANQEHVERLKCSVQEWNTWRREHPEIQPDLSRANLNHANLNRADFSHAILAYADLSYAILTYADPSYAVLHDANISHTDLSYINQRMILSCVHSSNFLVGYQGRDKPLPLRDLYGLPSS